MKLRLKTQTPLHVGNGDSLYALDYVIDSSKKMYYRISQAQFLDFIQGNEDLILAYAAWIEKTTQEINELEDKDKRERKKPKQERNMDYNQQLSQLRRDFNLLAFAKEQGKESTFLDYLHKKESILKVRFQDNPKHQIRGHIKTANNHLYLPATSLKGAIRTALLYQWLTNYTEPGKVAELVRAELNDLRQTYKELEIKFSSRELEKRKRSVTEKKKQHFDRKLQQQCFYCAVEQKDRRGKLQTVYDDEKFDLFKLLLVSDGHLVKQNWGLANLDLYLVGKKRDKRTGEFKPAALFQRQAPSVEVIQSQQEIESQLHFNIEFLWSLEAQLGQSGDYLPVGEEKQWIGVRQKVKELFGLDMKDLRDLKPDNLEEKRKEVIKYILEAVRTFSEVQLGEQNKWFDNFQNFDSSRKYADSLSTRVKLGLETIAEEAPLIRLGFGSGFFGTTELAYFLQDETLKDALKQMMEAFLIGDKPGAEKSRKPGETYEANPDRFPKSRRFITEDHQITPLGWLSFQVEGIQLEGGGTGGGSETKEPAQPQYFTGNLNPKKRPEMDAEVIKAGKPNRVKVYVSEGYTPELDLTGYSSALEVGQIIIVKTTITKKKKITQVSFEKFK